LLFKFILEYTIRKIKGNKKGLRVNWTHQLLVCASDLNLLGKDVNITNKKTSHVVCSSEKFIWK
jgi:hypothetical protein